MDFICTSLLREVCAVLEEQSDAIGCPGKIVEIGEFKFGVDC